MNFDFFRFVKLWSTRFLMAYFHEAHFKCTLIKFWNMKLIHYLSAEQKGIEADMDYNIK